MITAKNEHLYFWFWILKISADHHLKSLLKSNLNLVSVQLLKSMEDSTVF